MAQPYIDVVSVGNYIMPANGAGGKEYTDWFTAAMDLPVKIKDDYLLLSPFYEEYALALSDGHLYGAAFPVTYLKQWKNPLWKTAFAFIPRLSFSDFTSENS